MRSTNDDHAGIVWALVEDGFHVGSRGGEFLGYIDRQADGGFLACNMYSQPIGTFPDLTTAMRVLSSPQPVSSIPESHGVL